MSFTLTLLHTFELFSLVTVRLGGCCSSYLPYRPARPALASSDTRLAFVLSNACAELSMLHMLFLLFARAHAPHVTRDGIKLPTHGCIQIVGVPSIVEHEP
jgi:hypothetical protein